MQASFRSAYSVAALLGFVGACSNASARDLEMLARLLIPAYMAQNFAGLCIDQDAQFLADLKDGTTLVSEFAEHVKGEVTIGLPESEAATVRVTAADTAQNVARREMQLLGGQPSGVPAQALKQWCDRSAKHFILEILSKHQEKHEEFDRLVKTAKQ
jgi:hypothetical protein